MDDHERELLIAVVDAASEYIGKQAKMEKAIAHKDFSAADDAHAEAYRSLVELGKATRRYRLMELTRMSQEMGDYE